jgi:MoaA/NifB/PqqE/SkfB family radical SAM enzyme
MPILVIQLLNKNKNIFLDKSILFNLLNRNNYEFIELGWDGDPFNHPNIKEIITFLSANNIPHNIVTQGDLIKDTIAYLTDTQLKNTHFSIFLNGKDEKTVKKLAGKNIFNKIIESMEYITARGKTFDIIMQINKLNYKQIEQAFDIACHYGCRMFIPVETFPEKDKQHLLLTDKEKRQALKTIESLLPTGRVLKTIQFEPPEANCSYFRKERIFINAEGKLAYCHFLAHLENTTLSEKSCLEIKILEENNKLRDKILQEKAQQISSWPSPRKFSSPCSYCLSKFCDIKW